MSDFPALTGVYRILFLYMEPASTLLPFVMIWSYPGSGWFFDQLIPGAPAITNAGLDPRTDMVIWQLGSCYFLLALMSSFVLRAVRDTLPGNPAAQERIIGAVFLALGMADLTHIAATLRGLPPSLKMSPVDWNAMTHGNITAVVVLFSMRVAWYVGLGRSRYWKGKNKGEGKLEKRA